MQTINSHKVQLTGSILGVESCQVATDSDEIRVGSALDADLVVMDPLMPPLAFVIRRYKRHDESFHVCECRWVLEVKPQARVFVNDRLTTSESLMFGDTLTSGCHRFVFAPASPQPRNRKSNTTVNDLYAALMKNRPVPPGFLNTCPWRQHAQRLRRAGMWAGALAMIALLLLLFTPTAPKFESIQPPMEVTVIADRVETPDPDVVRALKDVQRQTFNAPAIPASTISSKPAPMVADVNAEVKNVDVVQAPPPPAPQITKASAVIADLAPVELEGLQREPGMVNRDQVRLAATAPARRLTLNEAASMAAIGLQPVAIPSAMSTDLKATVVSAITGSGIKAPDVRVLDSNKAQRLEALAVFKPSPVRFENAGGFQVPVARMSESLAPMELVKSGDYQIDGKVAESEIAKSWKSGRFRIHAPGNPPPEANPATYCYVGRSELGGKPCLYVSFICADPNTDQIIANVAHNLSHTEQQIIYDDSLEIFLDTNNDRRDYNHLIVNARGAYHSAHYVSPEAFDQNHSQPWDPQATVKSSINREAGQWVCEILIPFERLGGVPAKGARWTVNFCRNFRGQREPGNLQSWFNVYSKSGYFHHPANFGMFEW